MIHRTCRPWCLRAQVGVLAVVASMASTTTGAAVVGWTSKIVATGQYGGFSAPSISEGYLAWSSSGDIFGSAGVYRRDLSGSVQRLVGPVGPSYDYRFDDQLSNKGVVASIDAMGDMSFIARTNIPAGSVKGLFEWKDGAVQALMLEGVTVPEGHVLPAVPGDPVRASGGLTAMLGELAGGREALMTVGHFGNRSWLEVAVQAGDRTPSTLIDGSYTGTFAAFGRYAALDWYSTPPAYGQYAVAFMGSSSFIRGANQVVSQGIFIYDNFSNLRVAAERYMALPGGLPGERFRNMLSSPDLDDQQVAFVATGDMGTEGVYRAGLDGRPVRVADTHMQAPGGLGRFVSFGMWPAISGGAVAFTAATESGAHGVFYVDSSGRITKVFSSDNFALLLPHEQTLSGFVSGFGMQSLSGHQVAFTFTREAGNQGWQDFREHIIVATAVVPVPATVSLVALALAMLGLTNSRLLPNRQTALGLGRRVCWLFLAKHTRAPRISSL